MSELRIESGAIDATGCISQGWELIKSDYAIFLLIAFVFLLLTLGIGYIPYIGGLLSIAASGPMLCGIYKTILKKRRGEAISFANAFEGFNNFLPAFVVTLLPVIPSLIFGVVIGLTMGLANKSIIGTPGGVRGFSALLIVSMLIVYLFVFFLQILLFFAVPLIAEHNLGIADAIKLSFKGATQNFGGILILCILEGLILFGGLIALCIGVLFVLPIIHAANIAAYKSVFPDTETSAFDAPPSPDYYGGMFGSNT